MANIDNKINENISHKSIDVHRNSECPVSTKTEESGLFSYTKTDYTTEIFKIDIRGLPKRCEYKDLLKFLKKNEINYSKVKLIQAWKNDDSSHAYVTLRSEDARKKAIDLIPTLTFKGCKMTVKESTALPDPFMLKRKNDFTNDQNQNKRSKVDDKDKCKAKIDENFDSMNQEEKDSIINDQVAKFWKIPYEEQVKIKIENISQILKSCGLELKSIHKHANTKQNEVEEAIKFYLNFHDNTSINESIVRSPELIGYRNKCEFNVDANKNVGFRLGQYKEGTLRVVEPPKNCPIISEQMFNILKHFKIFLKENDLAGYNPFTRDGHWKQLLVRTTQSKDALISLALHRQTLTDQEIDDQLIPSILKFFGNKIHGISSIYLQIIEDRQGSAGSATPRYIGGETHIYETLINKSLKFRISPLSFFQINTPGAEILYSKIIQLANCSPETTILDICCGTGTIGLCLAKSVKNVIGIEINKDAIQDAKFNAEINGINNIEFHCGSAEKLIRQILTKINSDCQDVVAIIDPPRCGLTSDFIKMIRSHKRIKRLVYVACEANSAKRNFIELCRPTSKAYTEKPFSSKLAIPVDLFPHTDRCELILFFERS